MTKVSLFVRTTLAFLTGDKAAEIALKNFQKATNAYKTQISALTSTLDEQNDAVDEAEEALKVARYPKELIEDKKAYILAVNKAKTTLDTKKAIVEETKATIAEYEAELKAISEEVDEAVA